MGKWVVTVAGIAILSVLCDVILPEGQTRKYVKTVFGVVVTFVIVQPVIQLFSGGVSSIFTSSNVDMEPQQQFIQSVEDRKKASAVKSISTLLSNNGIEVENIAVSDVEEKITVELNVPYSLSAEKIVKNVVSSYFPSYAVITVWK